MGVRGGLVEDAFDVLPLDSDDWFFECVFVVGDDVVFGVVFDCLVVGECQVGFVLLVGGEFVV